MGYFEPYMRLPECGW